MRKISNKSRGEMAELLFAAECCKHGLIISFPHSDAVSYDFIVDNGKNLLRVQVKSSTTSNISGRTQFVMHMKGFKSHKVHLYALYCYINKSFYIIPAKKITTETFRVGKKSEVYKNAWHLFKS
jgi:PD-(D/E)XK endonuclease